MLEMKDNVEQEENLKTNNKAQEIIKNFIISYAKNEKSENKKSLDEWLFEKMKEELPEKSDEELKVICSELVEGVNKKYEIDEEIKKKRKFGITPADCIGDTIIEEAELIDDSPEKTLEYLKDVSREFEEENTNDIFEVAYTKAPELVSGFVGANSSLNYIEEINSAIDTANKEIENTVFTKKGLISKNKNLDGFIFEEDHAGTFNIEVAVRRKHNLIAEALKPKPGKSYTKNSVDLVIRNDGQIVKKYQAKAYKTAADTEKSFSHGDYRGQRKLVPDEQEIAKTTTKIEYDGIESQGQTKTSIKEKQLKVQSGDLESIKRNFKSDVSTIQVAKQIGRQSMVSASMGLGIGMGLSVAKKVLSGENIEVEEVVVDGLKSGASAGLGVAVAGGLKVAVEKKAVGGIMSKILSSNNMIGIIATSSLEIISTAFTLGKGDITLGETMGKISGTIASAYVGYLSYGIGAVAIGSIVTVGGVIGAGVALAGGAVAALVGTAVATPIINGITTIGGVIVDGAVGIVKAGASVVKSVASGVWQGAKAVGRGIIGVGTSIVNGIGSAVSGAWDCVCGLFGW